MLKPISDGSPSHPIAILHTPPALIPQAKELSRINKSDTEAKFTVHEACSTFSHYHRMLTPVNFTLQNHIIKLHTERENKSFQFAVLCWNTSIDISCSPMGPRLETPEITALRMASEADECPPRTLLCRDQKSRAGSLQRRQQNGGKKELHFRNVFQVKCCLLTIHN